MIAPFQIESGESHFGECGSVGPIVGRIQDREVRGADTASVHYVGGGLGLYFLALDCAGAL
jgi:hypothetical protein